MGKRLDVPVYRRRKCKSGKFNNVPGYPGFAYKDGLVYLDGVEVHPSLSSVCKRPLKNASGKPDSHKWFKMHDDVLTLLDIRQLVKDYVDVPNDAKCIPGHEDYYLTPDGRLFAFNSKYPLGHEMKPLFLDRKGGPPHFSLIKLRYDVTTDEKVEVRTHIAERQTYPAHRLLTATFGKIEDLPIKHRTKFYDWVTIDGVARYDVDPVEETMGFEEQDEFGESDDSAMMAIEHDMFEDIFNDEEEYE